MVVVSSGAIALGLPRLGLTRRPASVPKLQAASALGQARLQAAWDAALGRHGIRAAQILLTAGDIAERAAYVNARNALSALFRLRAVPIVNENDATATDEITFGDNDALAAQVAVLVQARLLILLTEVEGVYSQAPGSPGAELIPEGSAAHAAVLGDASPTGKGGMRSKVLAAEMAASAGIHTVIAGGAGEAVLEPIVAGEHAGPSSNRGVTSTRPSSSGFASGSPSRRACTSTRVRGGRWPGTARACSRSASSAARAGSSRATRSSSSGRTEPPSPRGSRASRRRSSRAAPAGSRPSTATASSRTEPGAPSPAGSRPSDSAGDPSARR